MIVVFWSHFPVKRAAGGNLAKERLLRLCKIGVVMKAVILSLVGVLTFSAAATADEYGIATYYYHPRYPTSLIAAHKYLPLGARVRVHDLDNGRSVDVTIVDRGPFAGPSRIIDLSTVAANVLGIRSVGVAHVRVERLASQVVKAGGPT